MDKIKMIKWTSTAAVLTGIALTNLNIYPVNIIIHGAGATGWTIAGFLTNRALLTNFCLQLPLFIFGIINFSCRDKGHVRLFFHIDNLKQGLARELTEGVTTRIFPVIRRCYLWCE